MREYTCCTGHGFSSDDVCEQLRHKGVKFDNGAKEMIESRDFPWSSKQRTHDLVVVELGDMPEIDNCRSFVEIVGLAWESGLGLVPPECAVNFRMVYQQPLGEILTVAHLPLWWKQQTSGLLTLETHKGVGVQHVRYLTVTSADLSRPAIPEFRARRAWLFQKQKGEV